MGIKRKMYRKMPQEDVACCPCIKVKYDDVVGLEKEAQDRISYDHKNIDSERTHLNLYIKGLDKDGNPIIETSKYQESLLERILNRIKGAGAKIRHDHNNGKSFEPEKQFIERGYNTKESVIAEGIEFQLSHKQAMRLLADDDLLEKNGKIKKIERVPADSKTLDFFRETYLFACQKWGPENIVGAYIHFDEYTPHLHLFVVPLALKKVKYAGKYLTDEKGEPVMKARLDAKSIFSKDEIKQLWPEYAEAMKEFGATAAKGLAPKGTYDKVASLEALAAELEQDIQEKQAEKDRLEMETKSMIEQEEQLQDSIAQVRQQKERAIKDKNNAEYEAKQANLVIDLAKSIRSTLIAGLNDICKQQKHTWEEVVDFDIREEIRKGKDQYLMETNYKYLTYIIYLRSSKGDEKSITVNQDDYYKSNDSLVKAFSLFFFRNKKQAKVAAIVSPRNNLVGRIR